MSKISGRIKYMGHDDIFMPFNRVTITPKPVNKVVGASFTGHADLEGNYEIDGVPAGYYMIQTNLDGQHAGQRAYVMPNQLDIDDMQKVIDGVRILYPYPPQQECMSLDRTEENNYEGTGITQASLDALKALVLSGVPPASNSLKYASTVTEVYVDDDTVITGLDIVFGLIGDTNMDAYNA